LTFFGKRRQKTSNVRTKIVAVAVAGRIKEVSATMLTEKLTKTRIDSLKPKSARYFVSDGKGLFLAIIPNGVKRWVSRVKWLGRIIDISLGEYPEVDIQEARKKHLENRAMARDGLDPRRPAAMLFRDLWADWPDHCPL